MLDLVEMYGFHGIPRRELKVDDVEAEADPVFGIPRRELKAVPAGSSGPQPWRVSQEGS